jgi:hypothetical protein
MSSMGRQHTRQDFEEDLAKFKRDNPTWESNKKYVKVVASFNNVIASMLAAGIQSLLSIYFRPPLLSNSNFRNFYTERAEQSAKGAEHSLSPILYVKARSSFV